MAKTTLLDEVQAELAVSVKRCKLVKYYSAMTPEDQEALVLVLEDKQVPPPAIARALTKRGLPISENAIKRCRQHECWKES